MHIYSKATPTNDTDYNCRTCLTNHMGSCHITPLVIHNLGDGHTHMHKHTGLQMSRIKAISRNQVHASSWCTPGLKGLYGSPNCIKALPNLSSIAYTSVAHSCLCSDACSWLGVCYITGVCIVSNACYYGTC